MKSNKMFFSLMAMVACLSTGFLGLTVAEELPALKQAPIFDVSADGSKQIAAALVMAKKDGKRVLIDCGANWCIWCHRLHNLFESDARIAAKLKSDYVVVMLDVDKEHNKEVDLKYGHPTRLGLPVLVVLDADGKQLTTEDSGNLEEGDHHSPDKVLAFLQEWEPKR